MPILPDASQGDFIQYLMDLLGPELSKRASQIYRHTLTNVLETALNSSNAKFEVRVCVREDRDATVLACHRVSTADECVVLVWVGWLGGWSNEARVQTSSRDSTLSCSMRRRVRAVSAFLTTTRVSGW